MALDRSTSRILALILLSCVLTLPSTALAIRRSDVIGRARVWVAKGVPYSQSRYATVAGSRISTGTVYPSREGYRTDCSGFVSMCLNLRTRTGLPLSLATSTLDDALYRIPRSDLRPGDVILRPNDLIIGGVRVPYGHAVIFGGWTDASQTRYVGYHESSSAAGTVRSVIDWGASGFWSAKGFAAYRCAAVRDRAKLRPVVGP